jgi:dTDP-4-amino-4,6-dideoxygalactose transaminase
VSAATRIPVAKPWLDERDVAAARRAILSGWVTQGPEVAAEHACAVSSCTTALHLALIALGVGPGDEVVTVSHSFIATANAIRYCSATPVFVDVELDTFNIDPSLVERAMTEKTKALLVVHQLGLPCDLKALLSIANRRGMPVIEDAACAAGSEIHWNGRWERIGRPHGAIACFSFHPRKLLSTGDGGMLTTASADIDARLRLLRQHGMSVPDRVRHQAATVVFEEYQLMGFNYRLTDIQAAIGREQLTRLPAIVSRRRELAARYTSALQTIHGVVAPREPEWARTNWQSYAVRLDAMLDQHAIMQRLLDEGIATRRGVMNAHAEAAYPAGSWRTTADGLGRSEEALRTAIVLPLYHEMTYDDQDRVIAALARAVAH